MSSARRKHSRVYILIEGIRSTREERCCAMEIKELDINPELRAKAAACKTPAEILAVAKKEGVKLTEEQLESISGGAK